MERKYPIRIYATYKNQIPKMSFVQHDTETNKIYFEFYDDAKTPMTNISTATATVKRPDGNAYTYGIEAFIIENNLITFILPPSAVYASGECEASVSLYNATAKLTTQTFKYTVTPALESNTPIDETNEYPVLTGLIAEVQDLKTTYLEALEGSIEAQDHYEIVQARKGEDDLKTKIDSIDNNIAEINSDISYINFDISKISKFEVSTGTSNAITLSGIELVDGYSKTFIVSANNSGSATTINGKPLYKPNTTIVPNLVSGKAVTVWYNLSQDCFFIKASAEGSAVAGDVLAGKTFSNDNDTGLVGTMDLSNLIPNNIKKNVSINGIIGAYIENTVSVGDTMAIKIPDYSTFSSVDSTSSTSYTNMRTVLIKRTGVVRVKFDLRCAGNYGSVAARIYKNTVPVGIERIIPSNAVSSTYVTFTEDIPVSAEDTLNLYVKKISSYDAQIRNFSIYISEIPFGY